MDTAGETAASIFGECQVRRRKIFALIDEARAELGEYGALISPRGVRWETDSTFETQTPTLEDKMVGKVLHALMETKALRELRVRDHDNLSESAQQWWNRHRPSTAAQKDLGIEHHRSLEFLWTSS